MGKIKAEPQWYDVPPGFDPLPQPRTTSAAGQFSGGAPVKQESPAGPSSSCALSTLVLGPTHDLSPCHSASDRQVVLYYGGGEIHPTYAGSSEGSETYFLGANEVHEDQMGGEGDEEMDEDEDEDEENLDGFDELPDYAVDRNFGRGGGVVQPPLNPADRKWLSFTTSGEFVDNLKIVTVISTNLKRVLQDARVSYKKFSEGEKEEAWLMFKKTFQWDPILDDRVRLTYEKVCQDRFSSAICNAKIFWKNCRVNPQWALRHKTWVPKEFFRKYVAYWKTDAARRRSASSKRNRLRREGPTYLGGSITQDAHRQRLAEERNCETDDVPQQDVWLKTRAKEQDDGTYKWANKWTEDAHSKYIEKCKESFGDNVAKWEPWNMKEWREAVGDPKNGKLHGVGGYGDPEFRGVKCRKRKKFIDAGSSMRQIREYEERIAANEERLVAMEERFAANEKKLTAMEARSVCQDALLRLLCEKIGLSMPTNSASNHPYTAPTQQTFVPSDVQPNTSQSSQQHDDDLSCHSTGRLNG